ncbi:MAG: hypothetical protein LCI00_32525 [Chloroflexi bacterium]|nr:hypothetical protein [Chloroflexota bacterium]MCC6894666.1 hypothetical protein [Anaerolineae bacterium]
MNSNPLHILYTSNLRGSLDLLPRLHTFIRYLKSLPVDDEGDVMICAVQPQTPSVYLLDLGNACASDIWHCTATDGRSTLIALDAMGYHAANVTNALTPESRTRLRDNLLGMALVDTASAWTHENIEFTANVTDKSFTPRPEGEAASVFSERGVRAGLMISLTPAATTHITDNTLYLADLTVGQVGTAQVSFITGAPRLTAHAVFDVPLTTAPDPTIAAAIDFIQSEARFYSRNQSTN